MRFGQFGRGGASDYIENGMVDFLASRWVASRLKHMQCFLHCLHVCMLDEAEPLFRSQNIWIAYDVQGAPIAEELRGDPNVVRSMS